MKFLGMPSSGSLAGTTFSHNRGGQYQRNRRAPVQPIGTGRRAFIRAAFGTAAQAWSGLTIAQQAEWTSYALLYPITDALGQSITLTGQQMYVSINTQLINVGLPLATDPPVSNVTDNISPVTIDFGSIATPKLDLAWAAGLTVNYVLIAFSRQLSGGTNFNRTFWQQEADGADAGTGSYLIGYTAQFGGTVNGQRIFAKVTPVNQYGVTGTPTIVSGIIDRV
jgi:hypothetical protein